MQFPEIEAVNDDRYDFCNDYMEKQAFQLAKEVILESCNNSGGTITSKCDIQTYTDTNATAIETYTLTLSNTETTVSQKTLSVDI